MSWQEILKARNWFQDAIAVVGVVVLGIYTFVSYKQLKTTRPAIAFKIPTVTKLDDTHYQLRITPRNMGGAVASDIRQDSQIFYIAGVDSETQQPIGEVFHYMRSVETSFFELVPQDEQPVDVPFETKGQTVQIDFRMCYTGPGVFCPKSHFTAEYFTVFNPQNGSIARAFLRPRTTLDHGSCPGG